MFKFRSLRVTPPSPSTPVPARRFTDAATIETVLGKGVTIKGQVRGRTNLELIGRVEGSLDLEGLLVIRPEGHCRGDITTTNVIVEGTVEGNVTARRKVELRPACRVQGNIEADSVAIAEGSFFEGEVHMRGQKTGTTQLTFEEKRTDATEPRPGGRPPAARR